MKLSEDKPKQVTIIVIVAVVLLFFLSTFTDIFVGKAVESPGQAGIGTFSTPIAEGEPFFVPVEMYLNPLDSSVVIGFTLSYPDSAVPAFQCTSSTDLQKIFSALDSSFQADDADQNNDLILMRRCTLDLVARTVSLEYAGICNEDCSNVPKGKVQVARLPFIASATGDVRFALSDFAAFDAAGNALSLTLKEGTASILPVLQAAEQKRSQFLTRVRTALHAYGDRATATPSQDDQLVEGMDQALCGYLGLAYCP